MNKIKITNKSLNSLGNLDEDVQFRSLEKQLETLHRNFDIEFGIKCISVIVADKADAIILGNKLKLSSFTYCEGDRCSEISTTALKKAGRPKNTVYVGKIDQGMTANQFKEYTLSVLQKTHLLKTQIIKAKLLTKTQLEKYLADGTLQAVRHSNKVFLDREQVFKLKGEMGTGTLFF